MESRKVFLHPRVRSQRQDTLPQEYHLQSPDSQNKSPFKNRKNRAIPYITNTPTPYPSLTKALSFPKKQKNLQAGLPLLTYYP